ncbi:unnamed protein product [Victoria cruziana]
MAEGFRAQFFLLKDVLLVEFGWIVSLLASSWFLLSISYFGLISFLSRAFCFKRIDQEEGCSEKLCPCEERCDEKGEETKPVELLDVRGAGDHKNADHYDFQDDNASFPVESFRHAAVEPKSICFSFEDQTVSENDSATNPGRKTFREKGGDEAFSSNCNKLRSVFNGRFLRVGDFESAGASLDINVGGDGDSLTDFSSSGGSNWDMFSEGDATESSFEDDDFLTEKDFICIKPKPISDFLSLACDQCEEPKSSDCQSSDREAFEYNYDFLGEKDENYEKMEPSSDRAPSLPASERESDEEGVDDEIAISSMILEAPDLEAELVEVLTANEKCGFVFDSNQGSPHHAVDEEELVLSEDESNSNGWDSSEKPISEDQIRNDIAFAKETHHASPSSCDFLRYRHVQRSPVNQEQSPQGLQIDRPEDTYSSNEANHEDENHLILGQVEDTPNHVAEGPLEPTSDQNNPIQDLLKSEHADDGTSDPLTEPKETDPQNLTSVGENDDSDIQNSTESISERREERRDHEEEEEDDDDDGLVALLEHQKTVEKLKIQMKRASGRGLPTIPEESEWPKMMDDPKQWKVDNNKLMAADKEDPLGEMQRFYWSYTDKMRKLDVLNHQKASSIGFLKLADPIQFGSAPRVPIFPALTSVVSQNFRRSRAQKPEFQPSAEFMRELQVDLETVYVGQICLSWEYLHWQYSRYRDMLDADPDYRGDFRRAANEFQNFLVLLTRFIEDEKFKGPRVDTYVKNRCARRSFLQVPLIKEEKRGKLEGGDEDASVDDLLEIMEECLRTFWDFVKRDRDEVGAILKGLIGSQTELQDPSDADLFANIQATVQKKEKRLKDLHRTGNCLVKRLGKHQQRGWMEESLFFSLVDVKLVSRVLRMSRVSSDHLDWCQRKLLNVTFKGRKVVRDPTLLLFPS